MSRWNKDILLSTCPDVLERWDFNKNKDLCSPEDVSIGSHAKVWWRCEKGHSWKAEIRYQVKSGGCPYCSKKRILSGFNDLATLRPDLLSEWDYNRNTVSPQTIGIGSPYKASWICSKCGHKWKTSIGNRASGSGCPVCAKEKRAISKGTSDYRKSVAKLFPSLLEEWDYSKNIELDPETIYPSTRKMAWWICKKCGNSYYAQIGARTRGNGCPICAGKTVVQGLNDLRTWCKSNKKSFVLEEWDYSKNLFSPEDVTPFTSKKAWWICKEGHSYYASISNRTSNESGCPICEMGRRTSLPEQAVYYYIKQRFPDAINSFHASWLGRQELDVFIPKIKTAVEYDGVSWHTDTEKDLKKNQVCLENGVTIIRIRERGLEPLESCKNIILNDGSYGALDQAIIEILTIMGCISYDVDVERDIPRIVKQFETKKKEKSIGEHSPELLLEWDYEKNAGIDPYLINYGSPRKFWWKCPICNHSWQMSPNARTNQGQGCPLCSSMKKRKSLQEFYLASHGSLEETNHPVLSEWDYDKNTILPSQVTKSSKQKVWWRCRICGGSWLAQIYNRTKEHGTNCPYCSGRKALKGFNDLTITNS